MTPSWPNMRTIDEGGREMLVEIEAWHFCASGPDGLPVLRDGQPLECRLYMWDGPLVMCDSGLHASVLLRDALDYAPGPWVCRVVCSGRTIEGHDKLACSERRVIWYADATQALHRAACDVAELALQRHGNGDPRSLRAIECKRRWLLGMATDAELDAARTAALAAAFAVANVGARAAAFAAADAAARSGDLAARGAWAAAFEAVCLDAGRYAFLTRAEWEQILLGHVLGLKEAV